jgi:uncharacterized protein (TIGR00266 family)
MESHQVDYQLIGDDMQMVEIELDPHEVVIAEAGAMNYMEEGITFEVKMGDGSTPRKGFFEQIMKAGARILSRESLFLTHFKNEDSQRRHVTFAAPYPGKIIPMDLSKIGNELICQKDAFLCAAFGTEIGIVFNKRLSVGLFGGEGFILQRLRGDGMVFVQAGGTVIRKELHGESLRVDTGCIVAFAPSIDYDIQMVGGLKSMFFGGEGIFLATLKGNGPVLLQSLPFSRLANRVIRHAPAAGGSRKGEGSILGRLGDILDGD